MDIKELQEIISILKENDVTEFELEQDGTVIKLSRGEKITVSTSAPVQVTEGQSAPPALSNGAAGAATPVQQEVVETAEAVNPNLVEVKSPIVGTFYRRPSPDDDPFTEVGDIVKKGETLCIVEAMKLMNEIESPADGRIEKVMLTDAQVVEYGEVLFYIDPSA